jgi:hypothetical protein
MVWAREAALCSKLASANISGCEVAGLAQPSLGILALATKQRRGSQSRWTAELPDRLQLAGEPITQLSASMWWPPHLRPATHFVI